jgi:cytochrome o ubiquinol oxidase subunit 2
MRGSAVSSSPKGCSRWPCVALLCLALAVLGGGISEASVLDPKGPIARDQRDLLFTALGLMLIVVVPVFVMTFGFAWRYRASSRRGAYAPDWSYSAGIDAVVWLVPVLIVLSLGALVWRYSHRLDPYQPLAAAARPLQVQAVAQDWKWLFLYPEQNIAVVNQLVFPSQTPLSLQITSDTAMNSFIIPALGGQIYAMAGMRTRLHLLADEPGRFVGRNTQYSGDGFPDQQFEAVAASQADFEAWIGKVRQSQDALDAAGYAELARPSERHPVTYYAAFEPGLFDRIVAKYAHDGMHSPGTD